MSATDAISSSSSARLSWLICDVSIDDTVAMTSVSVALRQRMQVIIRLDRSLSYILTSWNKRNQCYKTKGNSCDTSETHANNRNIAVHILRFTLSIVHSQPAGKPTVSLALTVCSLNLDYNRHMYNLQHFSKSKML